MRKKVISESFASTLVMMIIWVFLNVLVSCEDRYSTSSSKDVNLLVVEGVVTNENTNHLVKLSLPHQKQNEIPSPVTGANLTISDGTTVYPLTESSSIPGNYYTPVMRGVTGKIYTLSILYQGKTYTAEDSPEPVEPLSAIIIAKVDSLFTLPFNSSGQNANYIDHQISWQNTSGCTTGSCDGEVVYYDLKTIDVNELFKPDQEKFYFPVNTTIIRTKYSVSTAYKNYLRSMLSETEWRGGVFDVQRSNATTNLSEGAIGFFAVSTVVSDTTLVSN